MIMIKIIGEQQLLPGELTTMMTKMMLLTLLLMMSITNLKITMISLEGPFADDALPMLPPSCLCCGRSQTQLASWLYPSFNQNCPWPLKAIAMRLTNKTQALWTLFRFPTDVSCLHSLAYGGGPMAFEGTNLFWETNSCTKNILTGDAPEPFACAGLHHLPRDNHSNFGHYDYQYHQNCQNHN